MKSKRGQKLNNPYPQSGYVNENHGSGNGAVGGDGHSNINGESSYSFTTARTGSVTSHGQTSSMNGIAPTMGGARSNAGTVSTENEAPRSLAPSHGGASSLAATSRTVGGGIDGRRGCDSTFSSPAPSVRSLTTTLTTIQSAAPNGHNPYVQAPPNNNTQSIHFSQPFPSSSPASAIPLHLAPASSNPTTYSTATANNLLTDNASILTLASSSKRRRRRSMDTDASVRALAPSSLWGGSRESLPLSVLSANIDQGAIPTTPGLHGSTSRLAVGTERNSIYSGTGITPAVTSERNSFLAKQGDAASVRSGLLGHGRPDSVSGSIAGVASPLATSKDIAEGKGVKERGEPTSEDRKDAYMTEP